MSNNVLRAAIERVRHNHEKAPRCAAFVKAMREAFGAEHVKVVYVSEGEVQYGAPA